MTKLVQFFEIDTEHRVLRVQRSFWVGNEERVLSDSILWAAIRDAVPRPTHGITARIHAVTDRPRLHGTGDAVKAELRHYRTALFFSGHWYLLEPKEPQQHHAVG